LTHPIVKEELAMLARVLETLEREEPRSSIAETGLVTELERIRAQLVSGQEQKDHLALLSQWDRASALLRQLRTGRAGPEIDPTSPYFAHLRLEEEGRERDVMLGKATFIRPGVRVVDWRNAPISTLFYRYRQGEEYEEELAGRRRKGLVTARRSVAIHAGALRRVDAPEGSFSRDEADPSHWFEGPPGAAELRGGEGSALRAAAGPSSLGAPAVERSRRVDRRLPEIAGLLDADQFELISRPGPGVLALRGSAGSGKTTVALHRIAFLAYEAAEIDSPRTLFMTLSPALRDYVGFVLPSLGVHHVRVETFADWAASLRRRLFPELPHAHRADTPDVVRRLKLHPLLDAALAEHVRHNPGPATPRQARDDWASVLTRPELLRRFAEGEPTAPDAAELGRAVAWAQRRNEDLDAFGAGAGDAELDLEDDALLLRAYQLRVGPLPGRRRRPLRYRHLALDEVQDYAPIELRVLLDCTAEPRSVTLAGDLQQRIGTTGFASWPELFHWIGLAEVEVSTLRVSYRSARPIMRFAQEVLGAERDPESAPESVRDGPPVARFRFGDDGACVAFVAEALQRLSGAEPLATVAVLTPDAESAERYFRGLAAAEVPRLEWAREFHFSFNPGVAVAEIEQAKGLEFDYVILVEVGAETFPVTAAARRLLHVGATRAIHQLWVTSVEPASPLLEAGV